MIAKKKKNLNTKFHHQMMKMLESYGDSGGFDKEYKMGTNERNAVLEAIRNYDAYGQSIYRSQELADAVKEISELVEIASNMTLKETEGWFDNVTANRHAKQLKEASKVLATEAKEILQRQQRLEAAYEDIGQILGRYYDV